MEILIVLLLIVGAVVGLLQSVGSAAVSGKAARGRRVKSLFGIDPADRARDVLKESMEIAARTKRRDTAESRLGVAEKMLQELESTGSATDEDRAQRSELEAIRQAWAQKPMRQPRDPSATKKPRAPRKTKADGEQWLPGRIEANTEPAQTTPATPRKMTMRMQLRARIKKGRAVGKMFPRVRWLAVIDGRCDPKCAALHQQEWLIAEQEIDRVVESHCDSRPKECRCTLQMLQAESLP